VGGRWKAASEKGWQGGRKKDGQPQFWSIGKGDVKNRALKRRQTQGRWGAKKNIMSQSAIGKQHSSLRRGRACG